MPRGVQYWYYTKNVPSRSVPVALISVPPMTSDQLTSINNTVYLPGVLSVWKASTGYTGAADFTAPDYNQSIQFQGDTSYYVANQFFQITTTVSLLGAPLYYKHQLPIGVTDITILDLNKTAVTADILIQNNTLFHDLDGAPYYIRYVTVQGYLTTTLLRYDKVFTPSALIAGGSNYQIQGRLLVMGSASSFWIRFSSENGFQVMPMYGYLPNTPWYPRIRFSLQPPPVDWSLQRFAQPGGYLQGTFVAGTVLSTSLIEFERKNFFLDPAHLPDILVFDKNNNIKYALDGSSPNTPLRKGTLYNWKRDRVSSFDPTNSRLDVTVDLDPTDIVYGFFTYYEPDIVYTDLDVNPFTNPVVKNTIVQFYAKYDGTDPQKNVFHQVLDSAGTPITGQTNDPTPGVGTNHIFASLVVGATVSSTQFSFTDARMRGGGLAPAYRTIPQADSFFDIGYWDGKPYPLGGALVVYLPLSILNSLPSSEVQGKVNATIPMGAFAVIRYFDEAGEEYVDVPASSKGSPTRTTELIALINYFGSELTASVFLALLERLANTTALS
jgi:hypothetical protein